MFLDQFAKLVYQETVKDKKKSIAYSHMGTNPHIPFSSFKTISNSKIRLFASGTYTAKVVREVEELEFLNDIIPEQTPL